MGIWRIQMNTNSNYVNISPEELIRVVDVCLDNIKRHRDRNVTYQQRVWSWKKMRYVMEDYLVYKSWAAHDCGIITRLKELRRIAVSVMLDNGVKDRDIKLSFITHDNLYKCYNKDETFEPHVFGLGY